MAVGTGMVSVVFGLVGLLFAGIGVALLIGGIRTAANRNRILASGVTVEARCLDTFTRRDSEGSGSRHAILGFTTRDGREIRIQPAVSGPIVVGDFVPVRYDPQRPERAVLVGDGSSRVGNGCAMAVGLVVCTGFIVIGLLFAAGGFGLSGFLFSASDPSFGP